MNINPTLKLNLPNWINLNKTTTIKGSTTKSQRSGSSPKRSSDCKMSHGSSTHSKQRSSKSRHSSQHTSDRGTSSVSSRPTVTSRTTTTTSRSETTTESSYSATLKSSAGEPSANHHDKMDEDDSFITVSHKKRTKSKASSDDSSRAMKKKAVTNNGARKMQNPYVFTNNRYEPLAINNSAPAPKKPDIAAIYVTIKEEKGSPHNYAQFRAALKEVDQNGKTLTYPPTVVKISKEIIAVNAASLDDYRFIMHKLAEKRFDHHLTRNIEDNKTRRLVLRGLPSSTEPEEIKSDLIEKGVGIIDVKQMKRGKDKSLLPLYLITLHEDQIGKLEIIDQLMFIRVRFEDYVPPKGVKQCFKCQKFHHTAKLCHSTPKCFKCSGTHDSKNCEYNKDNLVKKCVNCGGDHLALYKGCPKFKEANASYAQKVITAAKVAQSYRNYPEVTNPFGRNDFPALKTKTTAKAQKSKRVRSSESKEVHPKKKHTSSIKESSKIEKPSKVKINHKQKDTDNTPNLTELTNILQEACELGGLIVEGTYPLQKATGLVTKMIARLLNFSLKFAQPNGSNK